jgi:N-acetylglucosaminyldiphosphoundecaprenol N-acetyl-beta-D-mannosaminyltransferase
MAHEEDGEIVAAINAAAPDVLWVGLSTPKYEKWMHAHRHRLRVSVLFGVGAHLISIWEATADPDMDA